MSNQPTAVSHPWIVVAGANPRDKGIMDPSFGHYGTIFATVSFAHEYSHMPDYGATLAADYAERIVANAGAAAEIERLRAVNAELLAALELISTAQERGFGIDYAQGCAIAAINNATA